ncbi:MAG: hypothetical protein EAZ89_14695 [Bacteroidetes bacterium]|nr:MAG: hypothetical protein EAZ89_14695 [Bacteroidota bacterium]
MLPPMKPILLCIGLILSLLTSCRKYQMYNMVPEIIDVSAYIESGQYMPDSCEGSLDRLIRRDPLVLTQQHESQLQEKLQAWKTEYNHQQLGMGKDTISVMITDLADKTRYQYSYFPIYEPTDVYRTDLRTERNGQTVLYLFIKVENGGEMFSDYKERGWVINRCDSLYALYSGQNSYLAPVIPVNCSL